MPTHRELVIALSQHPETSADLRAVLDPFTRDAPATAPPADQPHAHASQAGSSACSVCGNEADHRLHRPPRNARAAAPPAPPAPSAGASGDPAAPPTPPGQESGR